MCIQLRTCATITIRAAVGVRTHHGSMQWVFGFHLAREVQISIVFIIQIKRNHIHKYWQLKYSKTRLNVTHNRRAKERVTGTINRESPAFAIADDVEHFLPFKSTLGQVQAWGWQEPAQSRMESQFFALCVCVCACSCVCVVQNVTLAYFHLPSFLCSSALGGWRKMKKCTTETKTTTADGQDHVHVGEIYERRGFCFAFSA